MNRKILSRINREGKYMFREIGHWLGGYEQFYRSARGARILNYHGICLDDHLRFNTIFLKLKTFEKQLKFYKKHFNVISLDDYYQQKFSNDKFNICLTFDDGFANNYKYVLPLLAQYQIPATFFITAIKAEGEDILWNDFLAIASKYGPSKITLKNEVYYKGAGRKYISTQTGISINDQLLYTGIVEKNEMMAELYPLVPFKLNAEEEDYWLQMTEEQIKDLAQSPWVSIGAHGFYHNDLSKIKIADASDEMRASKLYLENLIGKPVTSLAFPYGTYTTLVVEKAKEIGYKQLLALDFYNEEDKHDSVMHERFTINPLITTNNQMYATIMGRYEY